MKFTTNTGSTIKLVNKPQFLSIENRFKDFLKDKLNGNIRRKIKTKNNRCDGRMCAKETSLKHQEKNLKNWQKL
jgi:hypothetical protein